MTTKSPDPAKRPAHVARRLGRATTAAIAMATAVNLLITVPAASADEGSPSPTPTTSVTPEQSPTSSSTPTPTPTPTPSTSTSSTPSSTPSPTSSSSTSPPSTSSPSSQPPTSNPDPALPDDDEPGDTQKPNRKHKDHKAFSKKQNLKHRFAIDVANDSLRKATKTARQAATAADRARNQARRASAREAQTQSDLHGALRRQAAADAALARAVRVMNASPTGAPLLLDPAAAGLFAADLSANPDAYLQQSQTLTNVAETLSNGLTHSTVNVDDLEAAQLAAVGLQAQARAAKAKAVAVELAANRAQRQAKKVFLRFAGQAKVSAREAWWIDEFASSQLGRELAALTGGPSFGMHLSSPASGEVTSPYGMRMHPVLHVRKLHSGTDFSGAGSPVQAAAGGTVIRADFDVAYGNYVVVWHGHFRGQSVATLYAHCRSLDVRIGDRVKRGDTLGAIGETGYTTGPHLHFEVRLAGRPSDPELYLR